MAEVVKNKLVSASTKLLRRSSGQSDPHSTPSISPDYEQPNTRPTHRRKSSFPGFSRPATKRKGGDESQSPVTPTIDAAADQDTKTADVPVQKPQPQRPPTLKVQEPSSPELKASQKLTNGRPLSSNNQLESSEHPDPQPRTPSGPSSRAGSTRPPLTRNSTQGSYIGMSGILNKNSSLRPSTSDSESQDKYVDAVPAQTARSLAGASFPVNGKMSNSPQSRHKVWVRRPNASATLVQFCEEDLVDDVRETILRKYRNSLGKSFDSPDVTLRVQSCERPTGTSQERILGPEESMHRLLETYFPGGQEVTEALVIDVPQRRTPRPSPRILGPRSADYPEDLRPSEDDAGYFPPMPVVANNGGGQLTPQERRGTSHPHSISILETGQVPSVPSPREKRRARPARQHTSSPTIVGSNASGGSVPTGGGYPGATHGHTHTPKQGRNRRDSNDRLKGPAHAPAPPPLPSSPSLEAAQNTLGTTGHKVATPPTPNAASATSPRLSGPSSKPKRSHKNAGAHQHENPDMQGIKSATSVPPINVLIVEDNIINLRLMEMFVTKLNVRWGTAMNGRDAVARWRGGGYHLVLMDLQMPIMNGLDATKEIRRLERVNGIGVFAKGEDQGESTDSNGVNGESHSNGSTLTRRWSKETAEEDKLNNGGSFMSPVIIVALTASSLQSDRREALAAGCNDFLTKVSTSDFFSFCSCILRGPTPFNGHR